MIKKFLLLILASIVLASCTQENPFTMGPDHIGPLTKTTPIRDLEKIFINDSVVNLEGSSDFVNTGNTIKVFEMPSGKLLLSVMTKNLTDSSLVDNVQIMDDRYTTEKGVSLKSTFKDIIGGYTIKRIDNIIDAAVIFVNESDVYFTIDKKHLPGDLMFSTTKKIETTQIPDDAPIKYIMIGW
jgi:hypothetical protein